MDRKYTDADVDEMLASRRREEDSAERARILRQAELRLVELIGTDGDGGKFAVIEERVTKMETRMDSLETRQSATELFQHKIRWTMTLSAAAGSAVAVVVGLIAELLLKR